MACPVCGKEKCMELPTTLWVAPVKGESAMFTSDVDLYLTEAVDGKREIVEAGDPRAAFLLVNAGREIPEKEIETLTGWPFKAARKDTALAQDAEEFEPMGDDSALGVRKTAQATDTDDLSDRSAEGVAEKAQQKSEDKAAAKSENKGR